MTRSSFESGVIHLSFQTLCRAVQVNLVSIVRLSSELKIDNWESRDSSGRTTSTDSLELTN